MSRFEKAVRNQSQHMLKINYNFAVSQGFSGNLRSYIRINYAGYIKTVTRMEITPLSLHDWINNWGKF